MSDVNGNIPRDSTATFFPEPYELETGYRTFPDGMRFAWARYKTASTEFVIFFPPGMAAEHGRNLIEADTGIIIANEVPDQN